MIDLQELYAIVEEAMKSEKSLKTEDKSKKDALAKLYKVEQDLRLSSTDGLEVAREFTRNKITFVLSEMKEVINSSSIDEIISQYHIDYFTNIYSGDLHSYTLKPIDKEIEQYFGKYSISSYDSFDKKLSKLAQIVYQELYGYSILDELIFESEFNEVACNRYDYIWIQFKGIKRRISNRKFRFADEEYYNKTGSLLLHGKK